MNRSSAQRNLNSLILVANRFDDLCGEVTFVGGCITGLLITDKAAPDVRFTVDVDCIINVVTKHEYYSLSKKLRNKGFTEMLSGDHPICRYFLSSHDLEDIIAVIDGRPEIVHDVSNVADNLKQYLSTEFNSLINNFQFMQAFPGHLNYSSESEARKKIVEERIDAIIELGKIF